MHGIGLSRQYLWRILQACTACSILSCAAWAIAQPLRGTVVCIDPGHGGQGQTVSWTGGYIGPVEGLTESKVALETALFLRERMKRLGAEVVLTHERDQRVSAEGSSAREELDARLRIARAAKADYLISLHASFDSDNPSANWTRVMHAAPHEGIERALGDRIGKRLAREMGTRFTSPELAPDDRVVGSEAPMPAIMIEMTSLSNPEEEKRLGRLSHCRRLAEVIADAFVEVHSEATRTPGIFDAPAAVVMPTAVAPTPTSTPRVAELVMAPPTPPPPSATPRPSPRQTPRPAATATPTAPPTPLPRVTPKPTQTPAARPTPAPAERGPTNPSATATPKTAPNRASAPPPPRATPSTSRPRPTATPAQAVQSVPQETASRPVFVRHRPVLLNPVGGRIDQAWLYGETYGNLPVQTGVSFDVPEDTPVAAAAAGVVELAIAPGSSVPEGIGADVANYPVIVIIRHDEPQLEGSPLWTVYGQLAAVYIATGERVARGEVIGKTGRPWNGSPESRATALQFEVRSGRNVVHRCVNPLALLEQLDASSTGMLALQVLDSQGLPVERAEVRGIRKGPGYRRYSYSLTYPRGINPHPQFQENLFIDAIPPGSYELSINGQTGTVEIRAGHIAVGAVHLKEK